MENLEKYSGEKISQLPYDYRKKIEKQFSCYTKDEIGNIKIFTWEDFLASFYIDDCNLNPKFWWNTLQNNTRGWISEPVYIVHLNVLDFLNIRRKTSYIDPALTILGWGEEPVLIVNANFSSFGKGYILLEAQPSKEEAKLLINRILTFSEAIEAAKKYTKKKEEVIK